MNGNSGHEAHEEQKPTHVDMFWVSSGTSNWKRMNTRSLNASFYISDKRVDKLVDNVLVSVFL